MSRYSELHRLQGPIERLAWEAARQREYLANLGVAPSVDELAIEFDDALRTAANVLRAPGMSAELRDVILQIDRKLSEMSDEAKDMAWRWEALEGPEWSEIRRLAVRAYDALIRIGH